MVSSVLSFYKSHSEGILVCKSFTIFLIAFIEQSLKTSISGIKSTNLAKLFSIAHCLFGNFHNMNVNNFLTISLEVGHLGSYKIFLLQITNISFKACLC